jgi:DnaJ-class molecular chaperone
MADRDYYDILGVNKNADPDQIKRAYRKLAKQHHPDQNKGNKAAETKFKEVQEAYAVLSDKEKRARYDQYGKAGVDFSGAQGAPWGYPGGGGGQTVEYDVGDLGDIFDFSGYESGGRRGGAASIFEQFFSGRPGARVSAGGTAAARDIEYDLNLTFEQAVRGASLDLQVDVGKGKIQTISVRIPPGVRDGQVIRVKGKGQPGTGRRPAGDLRIICHVQPHRYFERRGDDIYLDVPITFTESAIGAKIDLPTLDGTRTVTVPPGAASGTKLRLAGLGIASAKDGTRGDQFVVIKIVPPTALTDESRELFRKLATLHPQNPRQGLWS